MAWRREERGLQRVSSSGKKTKRGDSLFAKRRGAYHRRGQNSLLLRVAAPVRVCRGGRRLYRLRGDLPRWRAQIRPSLIGLRAPFALLYIPAAGSAHLSPVPTFWRCFNFARESLSRDARSAASRRRPCTAYSAAAKVAACNRRHGASAAGNLSLPLFCLICAAGVDLQTCYSYGTREGRFAWFLSTYAALTKTSPSLHPLLESFWVLFGGAAGQQRKEKRRHERRFVGNETGGGQYAGNFSTWYYLGRLLTVQPSAYSTYHSAFCLLDHVPAYLCREAGCAMASSGLVHAAGGGNMCVALTRQMVLLASITLNRRTYLGGLITRRGRWGTHTANRRSRMRYQHGGCDTSHCGRRNANNASRSPLDILACGGG